MAMLGKALVFVLMIDVFIFLGQAAIIDLNPAGTDFYNCENSTLGSVGDCTTYTVSQDPKDQLPGGGTAVDADDGGFFTDIFNSIKEFVLEDLKLNYITRILNGPMNILRALQLPEAFVWSVGTLWYGLTFFLIVSFMWGRQGE